MQMINNYLNSLESYLPDQLKKDVEKNLKLLFTTNLKNGKKSSIET